MLLVGPAASRAQLFLLRVAYPEHGGSVCLRLPYLAEDADYRIEREGSADSDFAQSLAPWLEASSVISPGALLVNAGLRLPPLQYAQAEVIHLKRL
jgi:hypothetical protein